MSWNMALYRWNLLDYWLLVYALKNDTFCYSTQHERLHSCQHAWVSVLPGSALTHDAPFIQILVFRMQIIIALSSYWAFLFLFGFREREGHRWGRAEAAGRDSGPLVLRRAVDAQFPWLCGIEAQWEEQTTGQISPTLTVWVVITLISGNEAKCLCSRLVFLSPILPSLQIMKFFFICLQCWCLFLCFCIFFPQPLRKN